MLTAVVTLTSTLLLATKWLDCRTTARRVRCPADELNLWARRWMARHGVRPTIWGVFALAAAIIGISGAGAVGSGSAWAGAAYAALGLPIAAIQGAVARTNATGRPNAVTRAVARLYARFPGGRQPRREESGHRAPVRKTISKEAL
ncbi:MAG TPA: hypothetical protein PLY66_05215 [Acidobacteriota bacterium]|nr:hypothetical protein [Acidobacteriota bacterium]HQG93097.1 hypothetical protein [Acidobacteriota bacterium]HQK88999.1 hypothetical protein [Acidobacteriota bacterium]